GEAFHVGAVADAGEQVSSDLRFFVVRDVHACRGAERGGATPLGDAAALGSVEVDEVHGGGVEEPAHAVAGDLGLARGDRNAHSTPDPGHHGGVVVTVARFLRTAPGGRGRRAGRGRGTASWVAQPRLASPMRTKSGPAAWRAAVTRWRSASGASPPILNLQPAIPAAR